MVVMAEKIPRHTSETGSQKARYGESKETWVRPTDDHHHPTYLYREIPACRCDRCGTGNLLLQRFLVPGEPAMVEWHCLACGAEGGAVPAIIAHLYWGMTEVMLDAILAGQTLPVFIRKDPPAP